MGRCCNCYWWDSDDYTIEDVCLFNLPMIKIPFPLFEENECINYKDNTEKQLKKRIKQSESQLLESKAHLAAMRDFVEGFLKDCETWDTGNFDAEDLISTYLDSAPQVLAPDAGRELLERLAKTEATTERKTALVAALEDENANLRNVVYSQGHELAKAEAERVEAYVPKSFCRDQCAHWKPELEGCGEWKKEHCEVRYFHDYLRSNHMIREAE